MNHKRKRPKNRRAGCQMCKPWKGNHMKRIKSLLTRALRREQQTEKEQLNDL